MSIADIIIPAGVEVLPHHHVMEEVYHITEGEAIMMVEGEERVVRAGQSVVLAPHQWHNIKNHTDKDMRMIVTCAPSWAPELLEFDRSTIPEKFKVDFSRGGAWTLSGVCVGPAELETENFR